MISFFKKPYRWAMVFSFTLICAFVFTLLDTFVIPRTQAQVQTVHDAKNSASPVEEESAANEAEQAQVAPETSDAASKPTISETTYADENIQITIEEARENNTTFYVADILLSDAAYLKTALAQNTFGRNVKETTSAIAEAHDAIFAVNGDYYGFRDNGYVLRNGVLYRDTAASGEALIIDLEGNFSIMTESEINTDSLSGENIWQIFSFGPALMQNGEVMVNANSEVSQSKSSNPRTAIGQISALHYIVIVSDGRTQESEGLSLLQLAEEFAKRGAVIAYNLDGGGSSTMYFNGEIINNPTSGRKRVKEREVSDIVYIGYE